MGLMIASEGFQQNITGWILILMLVINITFNIINVFYHAFLDGRVKVRRLIQYIKERKALKV